VINSPQKMVFIISIIIIITFSLFEGTHAEMAKQIVDLPKTLDQWSRTDLAQRIDSNNIFDYMNGGGELYLAYRFDHMDVYKYTMDQNANILVEVYFMDTPDDAFGLLSLDWGGDPVNIVSSINFQRKISVAPSARALYGAGLMRMCADSMYIRILGSNDTPEIKEKILSLGQAIAKNRAVPAEPELLKCLPKTIGSEWILRNDRIGYFRSHLVLNTQYYLSHQNILNLDHSTEAVLAPYESSKNTETRKRVYVLYLKYTTQETAKNALFSFTKNYLPEHQKDNDAGLRNKPSNCFNIEDGWIGYQLNNDSLVLVFDSPDKASTQAILKHILDKPKTMETKDEK